MVDKNKMSKLIKKLNEELYSRIMSRIFYSSRASLISAPENAIKIIDRIIKGRGFDTDEFIEDINNIYFHNIKFGSLINKIVNDKNLVHSEVIKRSGIDKRYYYMILNNERRPSRDKVFQLCIGLNLSVDESKVLLHKAGYSLLSEDCKRDYALLFSIKENLDINETSILL